MRRQSDALFDSRIPSDVEEIHRIQLENNLRDNDLSFHPTDNYSIEYPRHNSAPEHFSGFASFDHLSREHFNTEGVYSYRTGDDDDEGIHPFVGDTISSAAHHASAVTLNAGLHGRGGRRDVSFSAAEYDPDRPLQDMIDGANSKLSMFDLNPSRSRQRSVATFEPPIVNNTAELDQLLRYGDHHLHQTLPRSQHSSASSSDSNPHRAPGSRLKLSEALERVAFSPKRPRSAQSTSSQFSQHIDVNERASSTQRQRPHSPEIPTPKPRSKSRIFPSYPSPTHSEHNIPRPTPSTTDSKFTKLAHGLACEIEERRREAGRERQGGEVGEGFGGPGRVVHSTVPPVQAKGRNVALERNPFRDIGNSVLVDPIPPPATRRGPMKSNSRGKNNVQLPDVTGLTSAVGSPEKASTEFQQYEADEANEGEARLLAILGNLQTKLTQLEAENSVSRRRVRELELELEACKKEVVRERTRVMEREELIVQQQKDAANRTRKPKVAIDESIDDSKYQQVVEEKRALEALINTLRAHLARLTSELAEHKALLDELRASRKSDARTLREKCRDVEQLRVEVERLSGEVDVLRGVVEEGLKERSIVRENISLSYVTEDLENDGEAAQDRCNQEESLIERQPSPTPSPQPRSRAQRPMPVSDRTPRTDYATIGSSHTALPCSYNEELQRVGAELEERRTERSISALSNSRSRSLSRSQSLSPPFAVNHTPEDVPVLPVPLISAPSHQTRIRDQQQPEAEQEVPSRPAAPTPAHAAAYNHVLEQARRPPQQDILQSTVAGPSTLETPFPQIRGERLERLFFSVPDHNVKMCKMCHRRRRRRSSSADRGDMSWLPSCRQPNMRARVDQEQEIGDDDEGFAEGSDDDGLVGDIRRATKREKGKERVVFDGADVTEREVEDDRLPQQTVLARVVRELEDDFSHYKSAYIELADQYKLMDAASNVQKRNVLAEHLREVIDTLEQKGDQIASLYDLLTFKDKAVSESVVPDKSAKRHSGSTPATTTGRRQGLKKHPTVA